MISICYTRFSKMVARFFAVRLPTPYQVTSRVLAAKSQELVGAESELAAVRQNLASVQREISIKTDLANPLFTTPSVTDESKRAASDRADYLGEIAGTLSAECGALERTISALRPEFLAATRAAVNAARHDAAAEIVRLSDALADAVDTLNATGAALEAAGAPTKTFPTIPYLAAFSALAQKIVVETEMVA
jgi:hypothetical protein